MKLKKLLGLALSGVLTISAIGCRKTQPENIDEKGNNKIVIGASAVPHAEILEEVKPILQEKGYELDIKVFDDYTLLNTALDEGSIDANFFQHVPYLEDTIDGQGYDLTYTAKVHIEPMGLYSKSIKSLDELKENSTIAIPNDASNAARALKLLEDNGVIKLKDVETPGAEDAAEIPKNKNPTQIGRVWGSATFKAFRFIDSSPCFFTLLRQFIFLPYHKNPSAVKQKHPVEHYNK